MHVHFHIHVHLRLSLHIYIYRYIHMYMCVCVCVSLCLLCGAVSCRVSRVVARYVLFVVRDLSLVVDCLSFVLCSVVLCCCVLLLLSLRAFVGYWSVCVYRVRRPLCCLTCWLLAGSSGNSRWTSGARDNPMCANFGKEN